MYRFISALAMAGAFLLAAPVRAAPPIEAYGKLPAIEQVSLSPSGQRSAFIAVVGDTRELIVATADAKPLVVAKIDAVKVRALTWADEDHLAVTMSSTVKLGMDFTTSAVEFTNVLVVNVATRKDVSVFRGHDQVERPVIGVYGFAQINGRSYGYFGGISNPDPLSGARNSAPHTYPDLYRVDLDTGELRRVAEGSYDTEGWLVGPDGVVIARSMYAETVGRWTVLSGSYNATVLASGEYPYGGVEQLLRGRKTDEVLIRRPTDTGDIDETIPLTGGSATPVEHQNEINELLTDRRSGLWIGYTTFGDVPETKMFDPVAQARVEAAFRPFSGGTVRLDSWSDDFHRMIIFTSGDNDPGSYWLVDTVTGDAKPFGREHPDVQPADVGPIKMVEWKAADGLAIHGVLTLPPGRQPKNLPVVVLPHGGPQERDYPVFDWWAQAFASQGYAVLQPNYRGSSGYGAGFVKAGHGQWGRKMQTDVSDGVAELAKEGVIDPKRACIVGASYGGYAALAGVTVRQGLYRCAVADAGVADLAEMLRYEYDKRNGDSASTRYWKAFMGPESGFNEISPVRLVAKADAPILLIHGRDDTVVLYDQSAAMQRALLAAGKTVELVTMPNEDHWLSREATRVMMLKASVAFVEKYNPPDPPPADVAAR